MRLPRNYFAILLISMSRILMAAGADDVNQRPVLGEREFLADAYADAMVHYADRLSKPLADCRFSIFQAFAVDLDSDGESEYVVAGDIEGQRIQVVMAYTWNGEQWQAAILNRARGGGIDDVQVVDINHDGQSEVFSVLRDDGLRRYCRIYSIDSQRRWHELFGFDSKGGFTNSCNISLTHSGGKENYRVRVDEVNYPDSDEGEVMQRTYFFLFDNGQFVLENKSEKNGSKL